MDNELEFEYESDDPEVLLMREYLRERWKTFEKPNDADYAVNPTQWAKLISAAAVLTSICGDTGTVHPVNIKPSMQNGDIIADFDLIDLRGDDVAKFCKVLSCASTFGITVMNDMVHFEMLVPKVFEKTT